MLIEPYKIPVAQSMIALADSLLLRDGDALARYVCLWAAFNNIYMTIGDGDGLHVTLRQKNGSLATRPVAGVNIPQVDAPLERDLIRNVVRQVPDSVGRALLLHENVSWFAQRTPNWQGSALARDVHGQRLNGVLNVGHTVSRDNPVWAPIDVALHMECVRADGAHAGAAELIPQIVNLLYTVRNNIAHGGKSPDDRSDRDIVLRAAPLLEILVKGLIRNAAHPGRDGVTAQAKPGSP